MSTVTVPAPSAATLTQPGAVLEPKPVWECRISQIFWVNSVAISDDGKRIVAATFLHDYQRRDDKFIPNVNGWFKFCCFDEQPPEQGKRKAPFYEDPYVGRDGIFGVAVSGDGTVAAAGGWNPVAESEPAGLIRAYDITAAATDKVTSLLDYRVTGHRVSWVALSRDGRVLVAAADDIYLFLREGETFEYRGVAGVAQSANKYVTNVAVHPSGRWVAACDESGNSYLVPIEKGVFGEALKLGSDEGKVPFLSVAIAADAEVFAVGGGNFVYRYDARALLEYGKSASLKYTFPADEVPGPKQDGSQQENVRCVAISADGQRISAVANSVRSDGRGLLAVLTPGADSLVCEHCVPLASWPNSTSMSGDGSVITASDGFPPGRPAKLYCFNSSLERKWEYPTDNMSWPMVITPSSGWIASGCDDGGVVLLPAEASPIT